MNIITIDKRQNQHPACHAVFDKEMPMDDWAILSWTPEGFPLLFSRDGQLVVAKPSGVTVMCDASGVLAYSIPRYKPHPVFSMDGTLVAVMESSLVNESLEDQSVMVFVYDTRDWALVSFKKIKGIASGVGLWSPNECCLAIIGHPDNDTLAFYRWWPTYHHFDEIMIDDFDMEMIILANWAASGPLIGLIDQNDFGAVLNFNTKKITKFSVNIGYDIGFAVYDKGFLYADDKGNLACHDFDRGKTTTRTVPHGAMLFNRMPDGRIQWVDHRGGLGQAASFSDDTCMIQHGAVAFTVNECHIIEWSWRPDARAFACLTNRAGKIVLTLYGLTACREATEASQQAMAGDLVSSMALMDMLQE